MKLSVAIIPLLVSSFAASKSLSFFGSGQHILDDLSVPGDNPLSFCQDTTDYSLAIKYVDLTPNPPSPGKQLTIEAKGNFTKKIEKGAYINLSVKYGLIRIINQRADLCDQLKNIEEECPVEGDKTITKNVELPKEIPPGHYTVLADVYTEDKERITCLEASVHF
ncbi:MAG: hypothetical protein Q9195_001298 [Heterodermia aff. obscurata]